MTTTVILILALFTSLFFFFKTLGVFKKVKYLSVNASVGCMGINFAITMTIVMFAGAVLGAIPHKDGIFTENGLALNGLLCSLLCIVQVLALRYLDSVREKLGLA